MTVLSVVRFFWKIGNYKCECYWNFFLNQDTLVYVHPEIKNWIKYAGFEENHHYITGARKVYERAVEFFGEDHIDEKLFVAFAKFEERQKEVGTEI